MTAQIEDHGLLRLLTCGSVDDGKSTLIGRLLFDTKTILADTSVSDFQDLLKNVWASALVDLPVYRRPASRARARHHH